MTVREQLIAARAAELLTVKEYARVARCSAQTVYNRIWARRQPGAIRMGGQWRIDLAAATSPPSVSDVASPVSQNDVL